MNLVRAKYAKPMIVTSGYRSLQDHLRIYRSKGIKDDKIPLGSHHLVGAAVDILDKDGTLKRWCHDNEEFLREVGLFLESGCVGWQHFSSKPFRSYKPGGTIWFNP